MKATVTRSSFIDAFRAYDRYDQFGYKALGVLFNYLEDYENDTGEEIELDVIALCCDYAVDSVENIAKEHDIDIEGMDEDEAHDAVMDYLDGNAQVCGVCADGIVYRTAF